tara:strand:+ start:35539 stop:36447 length:909 start_codon:yes stop_codon:yes gene_type:complete
MSGSARKGPYPTRRPQGQYEDDSAPSASPSPPPANVPSPPPSPGEDEAAAKAIANVHRQLFFAAADMCPHGNVEAFSEAGEVVAGCEKAYDVQADAGLTSSIRVANFPDLCARGWTRTNLCGVSLWLAKDEMKEQLKSGTNPGPQTFIFLITYLHPCVSELHVSVDLVRVRPRAKIVMFRAGEKKERPLHALFKLTLPGGQTFAADFSIGQYGHDEDECWWQRFEDYLENFTIPAVDNGAEVSEGDLDATLDAAVDRFGGYWHRAKPLLYGAIDLDGLAEDEDRLAAAHGRAKFLLDEALEG